MRFEYLSEIVFNKNTSIKKVLKAFNDTAVLTEERGFAIIVDNEGRSIGVVSDGDIRRKFLENVSIESPIEVALNEDYIYVTENDSTHKILRQFDKKIANLLVLDKKGNLLIYTNIQKFVVSSRYEKRIIRARVPVRVSFSEAEQI